MVNQEHKLTVDDLIIVYLIEKTKQGYIPEVTEEEFMDFLKYFISKKEIQDMLWDYNQLINRLIERKNKEDWFDDPHIEFTQDGILKPNYKLSLYDESVINPYFMSKRRKQEIKDYVTEYLKKFPKRTLTISDEKNIVPKEECKLSSALLMEYLWKYYIDKKTEERKYPKQCNDIIKYLIEEELAPKIELESVREKYLNFYLDFARKVSCLLDRDPNLKIDNYWSHFLAYSNYQIITNDSQENILRSFCEEYGNNFQIDFSTLTMYVDNLDRLRYYFSDGENKNFQTNTHAKKLVKAIASKSK